MSELVEKRLPGKPIPLEELVAEWREIQHRNRLKGVLAVKSRVVVYEVVA